MKNCVYRFRSTRALLEEFQELERQEVYFASPQELNDPLEGLKDIFWRGDEIVWTNLLRHYLLCLMQAVMTAIQNGPNHQLTDHDVPVLLTEEGLTPASRLVFQAICDKFLVNQEVSPLFGLLAARISVVRRNELLSLLRLLHLHALKTTGFSISPQKPICLVDEFLRTRQDNPLRIRESFAAQSALDQKYGDSGDLTEQMSSAASSVFMQAILIRDYSGTSHHHGPAWNTILSAFPDMYLSQLEKLLYSDWYTACFVAKPTHAAMWGNYGDKHRGACLKFRTVLNAAARPSIVFRRLVGATGDQGTLVPTYEDVGCELTEVKYGHQYVEIDFFRSMGKLTPPQLTFWFRGSKGEISSTGRDLIEETQAWRQEYWTNFDRAITTKLSDWQHESEFRITLHSAIMDLSDRNLRKLRYRFEDLQGVIFGINTRLQDKLAMMRIVESKCRKEGRRDFEFHQAYYSRQTGKIATTQLSLLKFS